MKIQNLFYLLFLYLIFTLPTAHSQELNRIIVKIDNEIITSYDVKNKILTNLVLAEREINQENINIFKERSLENLIHNRLKRIQLAKHNFKRDNKRINNYLNSISRNNIDNLKIKFQNNNINFQSFLDELDIEFRWRNLIYNAYAKKIEINQNEIKAEAEKLYKNQKKIIEYNLSEIEILIENEEIIDKKVNEIKNVINRFSFEDAVVKFSISSSSSNDGKLGWINSNSLSNEILTLITKMNIGDVSEPVRKGDKIIILKLNDKKLQLHQILIWILL